MAAGPAAGVGQQREEQAEEEDLVDELAEPFAEVGIAEGQPDRGPGKLDGGQQPEQPQRKARRALPPIAARCGKDWYI